MRFLPALYLLLFASWSLAQPSCELLLSSFQTAIDTATAYNDEVIVLQGAREMFYQSGSSVRDRNGDWVREVLVERSALPFDMADGFSGDRNDEDEDESLEQSCEGASISEYETGWLLTLPSEPDSPVKAWSMTFNEDAGSYLPDTMQGRFEVKILLIPFGGTFSTSFSRWQFPAGN